MTLIKFLITISFFFLAIGCKQQKKPITQTSVPVITPVKAINKDYNLSIKEVSQTKLKFKKDWSKLSKSDKEKIFAQAVVENIIPNWIGTTWSFNGISETPQQGSIACGYFVTTILRDAGLPLNRIKLAQCASEEMIRTLVQTKYIQRFSNAPMDKFIASIQEQGYGLYIVGLDNHTGFIYNDGANIYFIHSTFVGTRNVQKEKAAESYVLKASKYKILGKLSGDERVLERWENKL